MPGLVVEAPDGTLGHAVVGNRVGHGARADPAPDQAQAGPRVDPPGQRRRDLGEDLAERVDQVRGQVRPGGVPAGPGHPHLDLVAGRGDRAGAHAELARVQPGVAVQREDPAHRRDPARREHVQRTAGRLLGGLEDEPDPPGQHARGGLLGQERGRRRAARWCARRGRRHGRRSARWSGRGRPCRPPWAARRYLHGAQRPVVRYKELAPSRCRRAGRFPWAGSPVAGRPRSARATRRVVRCSSYPSSGWACRSRRNATSSA